MIYVDELFVAESKDPQARFVGSRTGHKWCHMWCDNGEEDQLHRIAKAIGMKKEWFQDKKDFPHYDLIPSKRDKAIKNGAMPYSLYEWIRNGKQRKKESIESNEESFFTD